MIQSRIGEEKNTVLFFLVGRTATKWKRKTKTFNTFRLDDRINLYFIHMASALLYHRSTFQRAISRSTSLSPSPSFHCMLRIVDDPHCSWSTTQKEQRDTRDAGWDKVSWYLTSRWISHLQHKSAHWKKNRLNIQSCWRKRHWIKNK